MLLLPFADWFVLSRRVWPSPLSPACASSEHGELIHESECSADAANPVWLPLSPHKVAQRLASVSVVALRIFAVTSCVHEGAASCPASVGSHVCPAALANPVLIHEETVPLCDLFHLNLDLMELPLRDLPLNTVLFRLTDGFYGRREQWAFLVWFTSGAQQCFFLLLACTCVFCACGHTAAKE